MSQASPSAVAGTPAIARRRSCPDEDTAPQGLGKACISGCRLNAGPIVATLISKGDAFDFAPEKVTMYPEDFYARQAWYDSYPD